MVYPVLPEISPNESPGDRQYELAFGIQHGGKLRHQHQLAGLLRRVRFELLQPDGGTEFPELRLRRRGHCGAVRPDPGVCAGEENRPGKLLCGYDENRAVCADSPFRDRFPGDRLTGHAPDLQPVRGDRAVRACYGGT